RLGRAETAKAKIYAQVDGVARVDAVPDDLLKLVERPALAYRSRRMLDFPINRIAKITVQRAEERFVLEQTGPASWGLNQPAVADADNGKANTLAGDLNRLEAVELIDNTPSAEDLKNYGLDATQLTVTIALSDNPPTAKTLLIGKQREGKPEFFAKLADSPGVFSVRQAVHDTIDQPSLSYRPLQLWQVAGPSVSAIEVEPAGEKYRLQRDSGFWKLTAPFEAQAFLGAVQPLLEAAAAPRAEKYESHNATDLAKYGLDQPSLRLTVFVNSDKPGERATEKLLLIGK